MNKEIPVNSIGKLMPGVSAQFRDIESSEALGPNETGELYINCKGMFTEYFNNPEVNFIVYSIQFT